MISGALRAEGSVPHQEVCKPRGVHPCDAAAANKAGCIKGVEEFRVGGNRASLGNSHGPRDAGCRAAEVAVGDLLDPCRATPWHLHV